MNEKQIAMKVLDYWYSIEFLGQDSYEVSTEERKIRQDFDKYKKSGLESKNKRQQILCFDNIDGSTDIPSVIYKKAKFCNMSTWGNLTFYIGKIKRQTCIYKLASYLDSEYNPAETSSEYIPLLSFQCDNSGVYIKNSLSLSTILWALSQLPDNKGRQLSDILSEETYIKDLKNLEEKFFGEKIIQDPDLSVPDDGNASAETMPIFSIDAVSSETLKMICNEIEKTYEGFFQKGDIEPKIGIKYQLFKDSTAKNKYDEDNYSGLSYDFYSADLKMVKDAISEENNVNGNSLLSDLIAYICAPSVSHQFEDRCDFIHPASPADLFKELSQILNAGNAPLGKWPSKFMPSLMQQTAINLAISNRQRGIFEKNGHIFSVNGPPGTGKTTLLKEVIANNIVEKAILLSQYDNPENAFTKVKFKHGEHDGAYANGASHWYKFKNDSITDYGMLVTSCNNNAVENITKELPLENGVPEILHKISGDDLSEIYFTEYAKKLFLDDKADIVDNAWGLIAAPLGKKSNVNNFFYKVLVDIKSKIRNDNDRQEHLVQYRNIRTEFHKQLETVKNIQNQLKKLGDSVLQTWEAQNAYQNKKKNSVSFENDAACSIDKINEEIKKVQSPYESAKKDYKDSVARYEELNVQIQKHEEQINSYVNEAIASKSKALDTEDSVSMLTKIFRKSKYSTAIELAQTYREKAIEYDEYAAKEKEALESKKSILKTRTDDKEHAYQQFEAIRKVKENLENEKRILNEKIAKLRFEAEAAEKEAKARKEEQEHLLSTCKAKEDFSDIHILDEKFISEVLSENEEISTKAQITNPWLTAKFNEEREKLFYLALQVTKEFLLSSKSCYTNLNMLGLYWGYEHYTGEKIKFTLDDRKEMIGSLFNTLFLFVPVISSTFASVGRMLKDIKSHGEIGMLIIDEAGQAQPQMAVGALFKSRRAIIVGDPKQVEPIVTDDLDLLKKSYSDSVYTNYKYKSLSVQSCADAVNPFGTYIDNGDDSPDWVGCPLLVHRRCISPMYDISNRLSYGGIMKQQTSLPSEKITRSLIYPNSRWINSVDSETGKGNHFVPKQGEIICHMVESSFNNKNGVNPELFIISPFVSVIYGIRNALNNYAKDGASHWFSRYKNFSTWLRDNIGTVHQFQGKEANEVIFVLGCDRTQKNSYAVTGFVNSNMVNVAATRAKYRFYMIGDFQVWKNNQWIYKAKTIIDTLPLENIAQIEQWEDSKDKILELKYQATQLPSASSFVTQSEGNEDTDTEYNIDSEEFVSTIDEAGFLNHDLSTEQYQKFGFSSESHFTSVDKDVQNHLLMGMKLYYLLKPLYDLSTDIDASCCGILFCKGMELQLKKIFLSRLRKLFPSCKIKGGGRLAETEERYVTLGSFSHIFSVKAKELGSIMSDKGKNYYDVTWWESFSKKLSQFNKKRNSCCHPNPFNWQLLQELLDDEFKPDDPQIERTPKINGVFFESMIGTEL